MSRTGNFGRQPRSAPSLTNTLVSIAREFQNQRAQNIMDAWAKGGTFEGKKATDEVVLQFWHEKVNGVSKDDPLYDTYKNAGTQLEYNIASSKMTADYALHKKTDSQMVNFYLGWAKRIPKNSEFYRVLQREAGQYMRTVKGNSEAEARARAEAKYQADQSATQKRSEAGGEFVIDTLRRLAQTGYVNGGIAPAISAPGSGSDLTDFDPNDPSRMMQLISAIAPSTAFSEDGRKGKDGFAGNDDTLYYDDDKKPVTGTDILTQLGKLDPNFVPGAPFNIDYVTTLLDTQMAGLNERIARAKATGHMSDVASLTKSKGYVSLLNREVAAYPVQKAYMEAKSDYDAIVSDKSSSPQAILNAWKTFSGQLTSLSNDPSIAADDATRQRLLAERDGTSGVPTMSETFTGLGAQGFNDGEGTEAVKNFQHIEVMQNQVDAVTKSAALPFGDPNKVMWTFGQTNKDGVFVPGAGGREIGAATSTEVQAGGVNPQTITVPDPFGGPPLTLSVTATPVFGSAKNPITGEPIPTENGDPIAYAYDIPDGDGTSTQYGFQTSEGFTISKDPPWDEGLSMTASSKGGANHLEVDFTPVVAKMLGDKDPLTGAYSGDIPLTKDMDLPNGFSVKGAHPTKTGTTPGTLTFNAQKTAWATDTRPGLGAVDPITDFKSLTLSNLMSSTDGQTVLSNLDSPANAAFKNQLTDDAYSYAGAQKDPKTGAWVPGTGDQNKLSEAMGKVNLAQNAKSFANFVTEAAKTFQNVTTGNPYDKNDVDGSAPGTIPGLTKGGWAQLATDLIKDTPFEALGNAFTDGTNNRKPLDNEADRFTIKPVTTIKAPSYNIPGGINQTVVPGQTAGGTSQQGSTQTGSQAPGSTSQQGGQAGSSAPLPYYSGPR